MGFSVTAAYVILAVAMLTALSAASASYWKSQSYFESSRRVMDHRVVSEAHTNVTITAATWNSGNSTEVFTMKNAGATVLDITKLAYLFDGAYVTASMSSGYPKLDDVYPSTSSLFMPGDTLDVQFPAASQPTNIQVITEFGTTAHHP
jgi:flagellar protein FlaF